MATPFELEIACGQCIFFRRHKHDDFESPCSVLGKIAVSKPCRRYSPDLRGFSQDVLPDLYDALGKMDDRELQTFAAVLRNAKALDDTEFRLCQKVAIRLRNGDYISNFAYGRVMGKATDGRILIYGSKGFTGLVLEKSIIPMSVFTGKLVRMMDEAKYDDPVLARPAPKRRDPRPRKEEVREIDDQAFGEAFSRSLKKEHGDSRDASIRTYSMQGDDNDSTTPSDSDTAGDA